MTSSVASRLCRYERRMSCCFASSRERTVTCRGVPSSPVSSRRTTACPNDPVPPVTSTFLVSSIQSPLFVRSLVRRQRADHVRPRRRRDIQDPPQRRAVEPPIDDRLGLRLDVNRYRKRIREQPQQVILADTVRGEVIHAG